MPDGETNEQFLRVILYEDVKEYLFSLISSEARLSLIYQLIEFFSGKIYSRYILFCVESFLQSVFSMKIIVTLFIYLMCNLLLLEYVNGFAVDIFEQAAKSLWRVNWYVSSCLLFEHYATSLTSTP